MYLIRREVPVHQYLGEPGDNGPRKFTSKQEVMRWLHGYHDVPKEVTRRNITKLLGLEIIDEDDIEDDAWVGNYIQET